MRVINKTGTKTLFRWVTRSPGLFFLFLVDLKQLKHRVNFEQISENLCPVTVLRSNQILIIVESPKVDSLKDFRCKFRIALQYHGPY